MDHSARTSVRATLVEFYDNSINNVYNLVFPPDINEDDLGLVYFAYYCNDLDSYNGEGEPFSNKKKQIKDLYNDSFLNRVKYLAQEEQTTIENIFWIKWCLDRCSSNSLDDIPESILNELKPYNPEIIGYYTWGLEKPDDHRSNEIMDGKMIGILLKGKVDIGCE